MDSDLLFVCVLFFYQAGNDQKRDSETLKIYLPEFSCLLCMTAFSRVLFLCVSLGMSFDKVPAQRVQRNPSQEILNLVHLLPDQLGFTVSALCHGHLLRSFIPHLPHLTLFSWVHFETPLTEFKNLESWDGPFLYLHIQLGTTLSGKKILSYIELDLS